MISYDSHWPALIADKALTSGSAANSSLTEEMEEDSQTMEERSRTSMVVAVHNTSVERERQMCDHDMTSDQEG